MSKQRMINTRFWDDDYTSNLDPIEKLLFLYFLTNTSTSICGIYEIPLKKIANETGIDKEMVEKILQRFKKDGKFFYQNGWLCIRNFVKHQNQRSPKVQKGIEIELKAIPKDILEIFIGYGYGIDTQSHLNLNSNPNSNIKNMSAFADAFDSFWSKYPKKELKKKAREIWMRKKLDSSLDKILSFIEKAKNTDRWKKGFIKQPPVFLNGECWDDDLSSYGDIKEKQQQSLSAMIKL